MRTTAAGGLLVAAVILTGCGASDVDDRYASAMAECVKVADKAMPKGMTDPDDPTATLSSTQFCQRLAGGYSREKFAELYNDPEWRANELEVWSDEGIE